MGPSRSLCLGQPVKSSQQQYFITDTVNQKRMKERGSGAPFTAKAHSQQQEVKPAKAGHALLNPTSLPKAVVMLIATTPHSLDSSSSIYSGKYNKERAECGSKITTAKAQSRQQEVKHSHRRSS